MAITIYDLPITGREEDVADQLAAYVLLQPDESGVVRRFGRGPGVNECGQRPVRLGAQGIHGPLPRPQGLDLLAQVVQFGLARHFVETGAKLIGHGAGLGHHLTDATHQDRQILWPHDKQGHQADHH
mgnify:CR=1 FL=1